MIKKNKYVFVPFMVIKELSPNKNKTVTVVFFVGFYVEASMWKKRREKNHAKFSKEKKKKEIEKFIFKKFTHFLSF